jgi:hypothetical protein
MTEMGNHLPQNSVRVADPVAVRFTARSTMLRRRTAPIPA